ncbi:5'-3' exoribonuclease 4 [Tetrabaena socialis]|uniref:5'-3' exoribonuclease 4 n=1 Tax=Tetrabaena socialis TaxID=47790 RepID=A0A2J7ZMI7_9CHLO|nr:5'-3' exoribonuclease 4 [Tetrabaena socialis]|eukprot:PNH01482.1 5'-3' exoribonuclease 4 [Tetrabaena socialis]
MGVPHFYRYITTRHRQAIRASLPGPPDVGPDRLMLDLNCAVHRCAESALQLIQNRPEINHEDVVIAAVLSWLEHVLRDVCRPTKELFIALDGVPPRAKMVQQRSRRFISSLSRTPDSKSLIPNSKWDSCCVTPGTAFMAALCAGLHRARGDLAVLAGCDVVISDSTEPGEGEHKIFSRINARMNERVVVYGADADLIMLSMRSAAQFPYVMREEQIRGRETRESLGSYQFIDIETLRQRMTQLIGSSDEFVVLCILLGNDFVPPLSFLRVRERGIETLVDLYNRLRHGPGPGPMGGGPPTNDFQLYDSVKKALNFSAVSALVDAVSAVENDAFHRVDSAYTDARQGRAYDAMPFLNDPWVLSIEASDTSRILPGVDGWRPRYYATLFPKVDVSTVCQRYAQGLSWTVAYYFAYDGTKARQSDWYYPYAYSPTSLDLSNYLRVLGEDGFRKITSDAVDKAGPVTLSACRDPKLQLLLVLPPASVSLLPPNLQRIVTDISIGCAHFFPNRFRLSTYLKWHASDCLAVLPDIDGSQVQRAFQRLSRRH